MRKTEVKEADLIAVVADVLGVPAGELSLETTYSSIPAWDSMAQLRLVMEMQSRWNVAIPFADVTSVTSLWEFYRRLNALSPKKVVALDLDGTALGIELSELFLYHTRHDGRVFWLDQRIANATVRGLQNDIDIHFNRNALLDGCITAFSFWLSAEYNASCIEIAAAIGISLSSFCKISLL